jgi:hypothetical protein
MPKRNIYLISPKNSCTTNLWPLVWCPVGPTLAGPLNFNSIKGAIFDKKILPIVLFRHYATSWKVAGSIPDEIIGFFNWPNPSSCTMALGSTQPLTEFSTRNLPGVKGSRAREVDNLTAICEPIVYKMREPRRLTTLWAFTGCYRDSFSFLP